MKLYTLVCLPFIAVMNVAPLHAASPLTARLWASGKDRIETVKCPVTGDVDVEHCLAVQVQSQAGAEVLGQGYSQVKILWQGKSNHGQPDALVLGDYGGSSGLSDLYAISFSPGLGVWRLSVEPGEAVTVDKGKPSLCIGLPFGIGGFNGAPSSATTIVPIPVCWAAGGFMLDKKALFARSFSKEDLQFRGLAIGYELKRWAQDIDPATDVYPLKTTGGTPVTVSGLADLILSGHADVARAMLHRHWPSTPERLDVPMGGEDQFWASLCSEIIRSEDWRRFELDQVPHAEMVETAAKGIQN